MPKAINSASANWQIGPTTATDPQWLAERRRYGIPDWMADSAAIRYMDDTDKQRQRVSNWGAALNALTTIPRAQMPNLGAAYNALLGPSGILNGSDPTTVAAQRKR